MRHPALLFLLMLGGCATSTRFQDRQVLWRDPDSAPIRQPRAPLPTGIQYAGLRDALVFPADRALALDYGVESENVNALDEVPDSSWWVDIRRTGDEHARPRHFTADEMRRGPFGDDAGPVPPFTVVKGKTIGSTPGLVITDARGQRYMFKLDPPGWLGLNTSTEVVASRLAWAAGWLVPAEMIVDVRPDQLVLSPKAHAKDSRDRDIPLTQAMLDDLLHRTPREADGTLRVCAGKWLEGRSLGPWRYMGRRGDDPNDRIDHQNRRDVRAFGVFAAWMNDIDTMENNTMDSYVGEDGRGHVVHYQQDVGGSFGQFAAIPAEVWMGQETYFMPGRILASLASFGAMGRTFDDDRREVRRKMLLEKYHELGYFDDEGFDAANWHPILDNPAFVRMTARDRYWGTKRVLAFNEEEVRAAVALGHYAPATEQRLFEILWHRREGILRAFLDESVPLDYFRFEAGRLCFDDLRTDQAKCMTTDLSTGYHVVDLSTKHRTLKVHYVASATSARVIGIER